MKLVSEHSLSPPGADATPSATRGQSRDSLLLVADLQVAGCNGVHQVRVRNLSSGGLMAEYDQPVAIGTAVRIDLRGIGDVDGRVAWTTLGRIGVALEHEINPMAARKPVTASPPAPVKHKPIKPILK